MLPLIVGPALLELLGARPGSPEFNLWVGWLFWLPAVAGGIFGLLGGYLTDLFGRRRVLVWSILLYAFSAMAAGFAPSVGWLLLFRCTTFVGVCVEFVAAVAWLAELFPEPKRREAVLGWTQAFSSVGGLMVTGAYFLAVHYAESLPAIAGGHAPWRYTLISGVIPALPLIVIRPFLPESPAWRVKKEAGTLKRPSLAAIFQGDLKKVTLVTTLMFACSYGAAFGAIQHVPRIVPGLAEVSVLPRLDQQKVVSGVQAWQEFGGLAGRMLLAFLAVRIVSRRRLLRIFQVPGLVLLPVVFVWAAIDRPRRPQVGHLPGRPPDRRPVQLLGQLPPAHVPDPPARDGGELRRERGRPHDRHLGRLRDHHPRHLDAGGDTLGEARLGGGARGLRRVRGGLRGELLPAGAEGPGAAGLRRPTTPRTAPSGRWPAPAGPAPWPGSSAPAASRSPSG